MTSSTLRGLTKLDSSVVSKKAALESTLVPLAVSLSKLQLQSKFPSGFLRGFFYAQNLKKEFLF
jgi:hypothetical protein